MRVRVLPEAQDELNEAALHYNSKRRGLGNALIDAFEQSAHHIADLPRAAPQVTGDFRRESIRGFPYYVIYRVTDDEVIIIAVAHRRRQPRYRDEARQSAPLYALARHFTNQKTQQERAAGVHPLQQYSTKQ